METISIKYNLRQMFNREWSNAIYSKEIIEKAVSECGGLPVTIDGKPVGFVVSDTELIIWDKYITAECFAPVTKEVKLCAVNLG